MENFLQFISPPNEVRFLKKSPMCIYSSMAFGFYSLDLNLIVCINPMKGWRVEACGSPLRSARSRIKSSSMSFLLFKVMVLKQLWRYSLIGADFPVDVFSWDKPPMLMLCMSDLLKELPNTLIEPEISNIISNVFEPGCLKWSY